MVNQNHENQPLTCDIAAGVVVAAAGGFVQAVVAVAVAVIAVAVTVAMRTALHQTHPKCWMTGVSG